MLSMAFVWVPFATRQGSQLVALKAAVAVGVETMERPAHELHELFFETTPFLSVSI